MEHQSTSNRKPFFRYMTYANIIGNIRNGNTKEAIDIAIDYNIHSKQFGYIATFKDSTLPIMEICKTIDANINQY